MKKAIENSMNGLIDILKKDQKQDGTWRYPFETGIATDCYMIILLRTLEINDEKLISELCNRIVSKQEKNGSWKLFFDEEGGNLSATLEAYYALLYSGKLQEMDNRLQQAKEFIIKNGGIAKAHMFTKIMLAITGQIKWPSYFPIPIELILIPLSFPINFYTLPVYGRVNLAPIMILADRKFQLNGNDSPKLTELLLKKDAFAREEDEWRSLFSNIEKAIKSLIGLPSQIHKHATEQTKQYMLSRIEPDGTFFGYFSSTFLMIFALISLGYSKNHSIIKNAVNGLYSMKSEIDGYPHMQYTTAEVWNTSLINYALQEAGVSPSDPMIENANAYLLKKQQYKYGDWIVHNPNASPGGWGFADSNTMHPDTDDTSASLRSISRKVLTNSNYRNAWERGVQWLLSMQNHDGGWPAFERNTDSSILQLMPIEKGKYILSDPSSTDLTGRALEFLGRYTNLSKHHPVIKSGIQSILKHQEKDGSWYGRWGICFIYGTWGALTGLRASGIQRNHPAILKAVKWLKDIQHPDGGWGESCNSDKLETYIPLQSSTLTHTAWAIDALISVYEQPTKEMNRGIQYLIENLMNENWTTDYPAGQGMAGDFYIHYHSYRYIFPLLALAHYKEKYL